MPADPDRTQAVFLAAAERDAAARTAYLDRECGPDAELRSQVEALLHARDRVGSPLPGPAPSPGRPTDSYHPHVSSTPPAPPGGDTPDAPDPVPSGVAAASAREHAATASFATRDADGTEP